MILHHYDVSPYSEKIRLMFGYAGLAWQSAVSPPMPPRPIVDPLVGGYRRIPVAQIGADLFCDSRVIAHEIAGLSNKPGLSYELCASDVREFALTISQNVFMPIVQSSVPKSVLRMLVTRYWPWQILRLMKDRAGVAKKSKLPRRSRAEMEETVASFKQDLEARLSESMFLFGEEPTIADFSAYHMVWFADKTRPGTFLPASSFAAEWQQRMSLFGHGKHAKIDKDLVFQTAKEAQPRALSAEQTSAADVGRAVTIKPNDYAADAVTGQLVGADADRLIIARHTEDFGTLHVHFPRDGYDLVAVGR